jgi:uncharacterized protein YjbI with pentapeptide repeats
MIRRSIMADGEHVAKLRQGVALWNRWRQDHSNHLPDLDGATFEGADLSGVNLQGASLKGANLGRVYLIRANLQGANLQGATLIDTTLVDANLSGATLTDAYLPEATLIRANLSGADLSRVGRWRATQLGTAYWDEQTTWPDGYHPPSPQRLP